MSVLRKKWKLIIMITFTAVSLLGCSFEPKTEPAVLSMADSDMEADVLDESEDIGTEELSDRNASGKADITENRDTGKEVSDIGIKSPPVTEVEPAEAGWTDRKHYFGSAEFLEGRTAIVAIFSNDYDVKWTDSAGDEKMRNRMKNNLRIACDYLAGCATLYGKEAEFYYDWEENPELYYEAVFDEHMVEQEGKYYSLEKEFIASKVDTKGIKEQYEARNVIYLFLFNTGYENDVRPWAFSHSQGEYYDDETINLFVRFDNVVSPPATIAHEMLHCFGAPDYYYASDRIPEAFVEYSSENLSSDIMFSINTGDRITRDFSDLTAYYVGLVSTCDYVEEWNLSLSERAEVIRERKESLGLIE